MTTVKVRMEHKGAPFNFHSSTTSVQTMVKINDLSF